MAVDYNKKFKESLRKQKQAIQSFRKNVLGKSAGKYEKLKSKSMKQDYVSKSVGKTTRGSGSTSTSGT